jgi:2-polyprenyl-3-methyl-5-hydroxy-6-metoxy-1,4-benzoquinol methylase
MGCHALPICFITNEYKKREIKIMASKINKLILKKISKYHQSLGLKFFIKGLPYERCAELPFIIDLVQKRFDENLRYLDIGSGESPLPTFFLKHSAWDISCVDKFSWVQKQKQFAARIDQGGKANRRCHVFEEDILKTQLLTAESFDIITNISVIEHFEGHQDSVAMEKSAKLLKPGGMYILTTLINDGFFKEFFLEKNVYGENFSQKPVYYQRHYDLKNLEERIIKPSGLIEKERIYFGDYDFQCFEKLLQKPPKVLRAFYQWLTPLFAQKFLSYRSYPISRKQMGMNTASGVILVMEKA